MVIVMLYALRWYVITLCDMKKYHHTVCTKTPRFPYTLLPTQEVCVYFVAMITLRHALMRERSTYARLL